MNHLNKISIIGLGLIGGSIAKALKKRLPNTQIASMQGNFSDLQQAIKNQTINSVFQTWEELITWSDLIILATPLSTLSDLAIEISKHFRKKEKLLIIDVSSVKKAVIPTFEKLTHDKIEFLSTHPMAGKENWGFAHSDPDLFKGCCWILSPHAKNEQESLKRVFQWIEMLEANPLILNPEKHDQQVALISHLPALISRFLSQFVEIENPEALKIAGPGFHSMTRLARDNPQLQNEIFSFNREELHHQLRQWLEFVSTQRKES
jgi:prephenate dehydrogenase